MCGICGFLNYVAPDRDQTLRRMNQAIAHRGPDGEGFFLDDHVGLGHRRLSIIDIDGGHQPMRSADERYLTVFNGEIYNYLELREELTSLGSTFATRSDTEVIAEALRVWGAPKASLKLRGMFAFAVYDQRERRLTLARDRTGIKPLYYAEIDGALFFASEQKALLEIPGFPRDADPVALHDFLTLGYPITPATCWRAIRMFPPASYAERNATDKKTTDSIQIRSFWSWKRDERPVSSREAEERAIDVLKDSLKCHLRSDVPIAAFLSGGIDSSLLVRIISDGLLPDLKTFNVGFDEKAYDESEAARHVAEICQTEHHKLMINSGEANPDLFETIVAQYDEPYGDSSCLPTYMISQKTRERVKTVISGDGGDELFGGYERFSHVSRIRLLSPLPFKGPISGVALGLGKWLGHSRARQLSKALSFAKLSDPELFCAIHTYITEEERAALYRPEFMKRVKSHGPTWSRLAPYIPDADTGSLSERLMDMELALNLHADYLRKVDIASSAHGLETRVPFLDNNVLRFAAELPTSLKIRQGQHKALLRDIATKTISTRIGQKRKQGFGIPFDRWCGPEMIAYLRDLLFSQSAREGIWSIFQPDYGEKVWKAFTSGEHHNELGVSRYQIYHRIFMLASIQIWLKRRKPTF